jgi:hypothetical protein
MAQSQYKPKLTILHNAEERTPESRSLVLKRFILVGAAAGLIVAVGVGIWEHHSQEELSRSWAFANEIRCNNLNVVVHSPDHRDALIACEGARDAIKFLASQDLDVTNNISIEIVTNLPPVVSRSAAGCYLESERRVHVLAYSDDVSPNHQSCDMLPLWSLIWKPSNHCCVDLRKGNCSLRKESTWNTFTTAWGMISRYPMSSTAMAST